MRTSHVILRMSWLLMMAALFLGYILPPAALASPAPTTAQSIAAASLPPLTLRPGDFYWSVNGDQQVLIFSRNMAGYLPDHYFELFDLTRRGGSQLVRIQLDCFGAGYTPKGEVDEKWARKWEKVFDDALDKGLYVIPVFSGWMDWNTSGYNTWDQNPLNSANGGPAETPRELMIPGSETQTAFLGWVGSVVARWQNRENILAWELYSEVNLTENVSEDEGIDFTERGVAMIRKMDHFQRPATASLAETGTWPNFYANTSLDFVSAHPYPPSAQLDRNLVSSVRQRLADFGKPVFIGESGLNAESPELYPPNAAVGVRHAIWAGMVSGAMNGRSLYWEDSFGMYFPSLGWPWLYRYGEVELPAAQFARRIDFAGFRPLTVHFSADTEIWGAALGSEHKVIGWVRDAASEPPDWPVRPLLAGQGMTIAIPGSRPLWRIDFFDTKTGTTLLASQIIPRTGSGISFTLPDFTDDIAFKLTAVADPAPTPLPPATTNLIAGDWEGTVSNAYFSTPVEISIQPACRPGNICGTTAAPQLPCSGDLFLREVVGSAYLFVEMNMNCSSGGAVVLWLQPNGLLSYRYSSALPSPIEQTTTDGMLRP